MCSPAFRVVLWVFFGKRRSVRGVTVTPHGAAIDAEWPSLQAAFENWLQEDNFDVAGQQKRSLSSMTEPVLVLRDPILTSQK